MIIQNGWIEFITASEGGLSPTTGHPIAVTEEYSELIPCQYRSTSYNALARSEGEAITRFQYEILIESMWSGIITERLRLRDNAGNVIGIYPVIRTEPLEAVCEYRINI